MACPSGEIGRRAALKMRFREECWFESGLGHHFMSRRRSLLPADIQVNFCTTSTRLAETPRFHLTIDSEYDFNLGSSYQPYISGLFTYQPGFHSDFVNYTYDDLPILNLYAGVRSEDQGWEVNLFVKNLFDLQRIANISQSTYQQASSVLTSPAIWIWEATTTIT